MTQCFSDVALANTWLPFGGKEHKARREGSVGDTGESYERKGKVRDRTERQGREGRGKGGKEEARGEASEESAGGSKRNES